MSRVAVPQAVRSLGEWPFGVVRLGAIVVLAVAGASAGWRLWDDALPGQRAWATVNASRDYAARTFPSDEFIGSARVAEDARLWMPEDARYRILVGEELLTGPWGWAAPNFLQGFLFPRQRVVDDEEAEWVLCLGCDQASLGEGFEPLSEGGNGVVFGRAG